MTPIISQSYKPVNPGGALLFAEKLRTFPGFETCSEQDANSFVESIRTLAGILVRSVGKYSHPKEAQAIGLEPSLRTRKAA